MRSVPLPTCMPVPSSSTSHRRLHGLIDHPSSARQLCCPLLRQCPISRVTKDLTSRIPLGALNPCFSPASAPVGRWPKQGPSFAGRAVMSGELSPIVKSGAPRVGSRPAHSRQTILIPFGVDIDPIGIYMRSVFVLSWWPSIAASGERAGMRCPTTGIALERREAPGPSQGPRAPGPPPPSKPTGPGILARDRPSQSRSGELRTLPGASRRSNPLFEGKEKRAPAEAGKKRRAGPGARIQSQGSRSFGRNADPETRRRAAYLNVSSSSVGAFCWRSRIFWCSSGTFCDRAAACSRSGNQVAIGGNATRRPMQMTWMIMNWNMPW